jgi:hypothetical protein
MEFKGVNWLSNGSSAVDVEASDKKAFSSEAEDGRRVAGKHVTLLGLSNLDAEILEAGDVRVIRRYLHEDAEVTDAYHMVHCRGEMETEDGLVVPIGDTFVELPAPETAVLETQS